MNRAKSRNKKTTFGARGSQLMEEAAEMKGMRKATGGRMRMLAGREEEGQSLVEFALVVPVLLAVLLGIFQCGILFGNYLQLTNAVGAGSQYLQQIRSTTSDPCKDTFTAIKSASPSLSSSNIGLTFTFTSSAGTQTTVSGTSCSGDQTVMGAGEPATLTATYPAALTIMGVKFLPNGFLLSQTSTQYVY
jgi:Flp pilus assembly protein TadG